ncbi:hypothetical protein FS837_009731 [Tulasnella sp. UAMH 9824]|nr:hypothetical protein FS837_009731 [Tulasnella sp. UAMH 9824]
MVRALESLNPEGASVKEIFDHVWLHNRAFILARSRDGETEAGRRSSTKNTIINYLSTSPAFDSVGRNRWIVTGKKHGVDKRGRKFLRSTKRRPQNSSRNDVRDGSGTPSADSNSLISSASSTGTSSPDIASRPAYHEITWDQENGGYTLDSNATAPLANNPIESHRPAIAPLPLSSTPLAPNDLRLREHQLQQRGQDREGLIVPPLPSYEAHLSPGMSGGAINNNHPQRETLSYKQSAQSTTSISTTTVALSRGYGPRRIFDAVPPILPPRPPRTLHRDNLDPFAAPVWGSEPTSTATTPTSTVFSPITPPSAPLFQIPGNTSYYGAPSVITSPSMLPPPYNHHESHPSPTLSSSSYHPRTLGQGFAQGDTPGDGAGTSMAFVRQHYNALQVQRFPGHDPFASPPAFV